MLCLSHRHPRSLCKRPVLSFVLHHHPIVFTLFCRYCYIVFVFALFWILSNSIWFCCLCVVRWALLQRSPQPSSVSAMSYWRRKGDRVVPTLQVSILCPRLCDSDTVLEAMIQPFWCVKVQTRNFQWGLVRSFRGGCCKGSFGSATSFVSHG
jgi:hypothetical protein